MQQLRRLTLVSLSALLLASVISCKKGGDAEAASSKSKTTLISQASWRLVKAEEKSPSDIVWGDVTSSYSPCRLDDVFFFRADGTWEQNEGATKCSPSSSQIHLMGVWTFLNSETQLKRYEGSSSSLLVTTYNIERLDETALIITTTSGLIYTRDTYEH